LTDALLTDALFTNALLNLDIVRLVE